MTDDAEAILSSWTRRGDLQSDDLTNLLRQMTDRDIEGLARILAEMPKLDVRNRCITRTALDTLGVRGKALIPAIMQDLSWLASPTIGRSKSYREVLQAVARRHGIEDDGKVPPARIERALQAQYIGRLRPNPLDFTESTGTTRLATLAAKVPFAGKVTAAAFPHARIVTAAVLEIAALRRIALMRELAASLEAA